jgi:hypothetical protein
MMRRTMPQRPLTGSELDGLVDTPFGRLKRILEERQLTPSQTAAVSYLHRDLPFHITVERCDFDNSEPYLCISESTNNVGFIFDLRGQMTGIVNYK